MRVGKSGATLALVLSGRRSRIRDNAMDLRQIKASEDDFGLLTYDPSFTKTASCRSDITFVDGERG